MGNVNAGDAYDPMNPDLQSPEVDDDELVQCPHCRVFHLDFLAKDHVEHCEKNPANK
jgi:hypothetical protein